MQGLEQRRIVATRHNATAVMLSPRHAAAPSEVVSLVYHDTAAPRGAPAGSTMYRAKVQCHGVIAPTL